MSVVLSARALSFAYGAHMAVREVSCELEPGKVVGLLGPNGAGKTTLLKLLAGLLPPQAGAVSYGPSRLAELSSRARAAYRAYVPQGEPDAFPYSVAEVVSQGLAHAHRFYLAAASDEQVRAVLTEVGFDREATRPYTMLSGGERQLVLLARALLSRGPLLLLDEPASHLDLRHKATICAALRRRAHEHGTAVLWSLHDLNLASAACDEVLLMSRGGLVARGTPHEVLTPARLAEVYEVELVTARHPELDTPLIELSRTAFER